MDELCDIYHQMLALKLFPADGVSGEGLSIGAGSKKKLMCWVI